MSALPTAPGVYVRELPSGTRSIAGVSTSLTAFVGRALRGPVDDPTRVSSFAEFEDRFGGLWVHSLLSQVVRQYFLNGGAEALIVRAVNADAMVLQATAEVAALVGFDHVDVTVSNVSSTTFDLEISARDATGAVLDEDGGVEATVTVDLAADPAAAIAGAEAGGVGLVEVVGDPLTTPPPEGTWSSSDPGTGRQTLTIGARARTAGADLAAGVVLRATDEAAALTDFDHLVLSVANADEGAGTFDLTVSAVDDSGTVLEDDGDPYTVSLTGLDVSGDYAGDIAGAVTPTTPPIALVEADGTAPPTVPSDGTVETTGAADGHSAVLPFATIRLEAADPGTWGNRLRARTTTDEAEPGTFHLVVTEVDDTGGTVAEEVYYHVTTDPLAPRSLERLLELQSRLVHLGANEAAGASAATAVLSGGDDGGAPRRTEDVLGSAAARTGMQALVEADLFNLLCLPLERWSENDAGDQGFWATAASFAEAHRAFLLVDPPEEWTNAAAAVAGANTFTPRSNNAALYFPRIRVPDPLQQSRLADFPPCGAVAGLFARTDAQRGVWKAPAGIEASLRGAPELGVRLTDSQQGQLNQLGVNALRAFPVYGRVVWGARTLNGADVQASEWKYVPVRRLALHLEESLVRGTRWAVFEQNDAALWSQLRLAVGTFMHQLFRQGAFAGTSPREAYFVRCDGETTTQSDIDRGIVNVLIGFAPAKPAEFVIIKLQQLAAQAGQ